MSQNSKSGAAAPEQKNSEQSKSITKESSNNSITNTKSTNQMASSTKPAAGNAMSKKEPEPPAFEKGIADKLTSQFGDKVKVVYIRPLRMKISVNSLDIVEVAAYIRDTLGFDHAESVGGTDYPKDSQIEVIYHLGSYSREELRGHIFALATTTSREDARLPTLINVYRSVEFHERETFEMLGVYFEGHPRNDRFLLPEDWADIPPLRKEFRIKGR